PQPRMPGHRTRRDHGSARRVDLPHHLVARARTQRDRKQQRAARPGLGADRGADTGRARAGAFLMPGKRPRLFLDADGVLADFDEGARRLLGMDPPAFQAKHGSRVFWSRIAKAKNFDGTLPEMPDS